ncbi:uncharacterized [Tachysurus ichikawai]
MANRLSPVYVARDQAPCQSRALAFTVKHGHGKEKRFSGLLRGARLFTEHAFMVELRLNYAWIFPPSSYSMLLGNSCHERHAVPGPILSTVMRY